MGNPGFTQKAKNGSPSKLSRLILTPSDLHQFLRTRRSVRRFKSQPVPATVIRAILETATHSPSAHNMQPWRFAVVENKSAKDKLGIALTTKLRADMTTAHLPQSQIESRISSSLLRLGQAPVVILLCRDLTAVRGAELEEESMAVQSVASAGLQLLLAAHAEGLAGNWICWPLYAQNAVRDALKLPNSWQPQAMFFLGYPNEAPKEKTIKSLDDVAIFL
ncbi:MAG: nitroreductase family protein [Anaerolineae bacterium]|nr:nitroreductase family protein [Anaerolineae bacterium]